jgi:hypothetical protein
MSRRRFVYDDKAGKLVEITNSRAAPTARDAGALWGDRHYDGMRATDGTDISTRTRHRAYMKANNVTTADDFSSSWEKSRESREKYYTGGGSFRKEDIHRAIHQLTSRR